MIGVFDSGYGGLSILKSLRKANPCYSYMYYGDNAHAPYGAKSPEEIFSSTSTGIDFLFNKGAEIIILGCNTASAVALRQFQQQVLPVKYPGKRVLGILAPTVEKVTGVSWGADVGPHQEQKVIGIFATKATVDSGAYKRELEKRQPGIETVQVACPNLPPLIEHGAPSAKIQQEVEQYAQELLRRTEGKNPDALLLGCTHYALIKDLISKALPGVGIYSQPEIVTASFDRYLSNHQDIERRLKKDGGIEFFTSGNPEEVSTIGSRFFGSNIRFLN